MRIAQKITIIPSIALQEMGLQELIYSKAIITEVVERKDGTVRGCWVELEGLRFEGEQEWYIPFDSIVE